MTDDKHSNINDLQRFRRSLLTWYRKHHRLLPWRAEPPQPPNPYHVLVSEAMLQQTQVATVIPYFQRFIEAFPTVTALAQADEQRVLTLWQGLGYYRRARNLHAAARMIVEAFAGQVPDNVPDLLKLPGVGQYTAGAVASIAHSVPAPILDGNVARVLARWFTIDQPIDQPATRKQLWALAEQLVPDEQPGDFNQAMMELGALICTPRSPGCLLCPMAKLCQAHQQATVERFPVVSPRKTPKAVTHAVAAIHRRGQYLFQQRPDDGLWSGMWQLPTAESLGNQSLKSALAEWVQEQFGLTVDPTEQVVSFKHQTTHRTIQFTAWRFEVAAGRLKPNVAIWRPLHQLTDLPLPNPQRRIVQAIADN